MTTRFQTNWPLWVVMVDYKEGRRTFVKISPEDVFGGKVKRKDIEDKIVLIGFLGPGDDDKFFTPLRDKLAPIEPDMYGVEYLANVTAQILEYR